MLAELVVRYVGINLLSIQVLHIGFTGIAGVACELDRLEDLIINAQVPMTFINASQHDRQCVLLLTFTKGRGIHNQLMFPVRRGTGNKALDRPLAGPHLRAFIFSDAALHFQARQLFKLLGD